jgi:hypothetical protein
VVAQEDHATPGALVMEHSGIVTDKQFASEGWLGGPIWIPTVILGSIAAAPWLPWSNRFSLRTLLIATTLVAVVLGVIVWSSH